LDLMDRKIMDNANVRCMRNHKVAIAHLTSNSRVLNIEIKCHRCAHLVTIQINLASVKWSIKNGTT
jgi:hypothetical protein